MKVKSFLSLFFVLLISKGFSQQSYFAPLGGTQPAGTGGLSNVFLGHSSGSLNTTGSYNTFLGYQAGYSNTTSHNNTAIGYMAGQFSTGNTNVFMGILAGRNATGSSNILIGVNAGEIVTGTRNILLGHESGKFFQSGENNIFLGTSSGRNLVSGDGNLFFGNAAGSSIGSGLNNNNTIIGNGSGRGLISGSSNTFLGYVRVPDNSTLSSTIILADGNNNQRLYINDLGNAGMGTTTPGNKLEINHATNGNSGLRFSKLNATTGGITNNTNNKFLSLNATGDVILQNLPSSTTGVAAITAGTNVEVVGNGSSATPYVISSKNIYTHDGVLTSHRTMEMGNFNLSFTSLNRTGGKIYIGETPVFPTDTGDYRLYVEGGVLTEKVKIAVRSAADWKDGVFANDYKLMPLQEIETFVKENKHLPGIESADELVKSGLDLGEMQAKQMGKIEELTLYVIEQNKEIEELKAQMKMLMEKK